MFLPFIQEELIRWHLSGVPRTRIRVTGVNFAKFLIKGKKIYFESAENSNIRVRVNGRVKMNEKWDEIQGKLDLVRVSGGGGVRVIRVRYIGVLLYK